VRDGGAGCGPRVPTGRGFARGGEFVVREGGLFARRLALVRRFVAVQRFLVVREIVLERWFALVGWLVLVGRLVLVRQLLVVRWRRPVRVVVAVGVVRGRGVAVLVEGEFLQVGEDRLGGRAAPGEGRLVQGQGPGLLGARRVQGRILLVLGGLVRPRLDLAVPGLAVLVQGLEEVGGAARFLLRGAPPVARAQEQ
jgi:hypothetical protein